MNSYKPKLRSPRNMRANCLRTLRKGCAQSETLYTDCGTAQHTGGHPSSAVCRPPRPGLQTDAARGVPTVAGPHGATYAGPNFGPLQTTWFRRMPPNAPSPVAQTGAYGRASHGLWGHGQLWGFGLPAAPTTGRTAPDMGHRPVRVGASAWLWDQRATWGFRSTSGARNRAYGPGQRVPNGLGSRRYDGILPQRAEVWGERYGGLAWQLVGRPFRKLWWWCRFQQPHVRQCNAMRRL